MDCPDDRAALTAQMPPRCELAVGEVQGTGYTSQGAMVAAAGRPLRTWKVETLAVGVRLWLNGVAYDLGSNADPIAFDLARAAQGYAFAGGREAPTLPERDTTKVNGARVRESDSA